MAYRSFASSHTFIARQKVLMTMKTKVGMFHLSHIPTYINKRESEVNKESLNPMAGVVSTCLNSGHLILQSGNRHITCVTVVFA